MAHIFSGKEKNDARLITWALETTRKGNVLQRPEFVYDVLTHFGAHITLDQVETIHGLMTHLIQNLLAIHQIKPSQPDSIQEIVTTAATRIRTNKSVRTPQNPVAQKMADYYPRHSQVIPPSKEPMIERRKTQLTPTERVDKMLKQFIENPVLKPADIQYILPSIRLFSQKLPPRNNLDRLVFDRIIQNNFGPDIREAVIQRELKLAQIKRESRQGIDNYYRQISEIERRRKERGQRPPRPHR